MGVLNLVLSVDRMEVIRAVMTFRKRGLESVLCAHQVPGKCELPDGNRDVLVGAQETCQWACRSRYARRAQVLTCHTSICELLV